MIPKRTHALRISQEPFAFDDNIPDAVEADSPKFDHDVSPAESFEV
jgi:hypothetical protein